MGLFSSSKRQNKNIKRSKNRRIEYKETLYSSDTGINVPKITTPPRREWAHISSVESKIDEMYSNKTRRETLDIDKKIDRILSKRTKNKK